MTTPLSAHALAVLLSLCFVAPLGAAGPQVADLGKCAREGQCRALSPSELSRLRGGYTFMSAGGTVDFNFGIVRVVYVNNELVALTQLLLPEVMHSFGSGTLSASQIQALTSALSGGPAPGSTPPAATSASSSPIAATTLNLSAGNQPASVAASTQPTPGTVTTAPAGSGAPPVLVNGTPVIPGSPAVNVVGDVTPGPLVVQNGAGNFSVIPSASGLRAPAAMVIQNTLNHQTISAMTVLNISMTVTNAINAANIQQSVRQAIANSTR